MNQFTLEKRRSLLRCPLPRLGLAGPALLAAFIASCAGQTVVTPSVYGNPPAVVSPIGEQASPTTTNSSTAEIVKSPTPQAPQISVVTIYAENEIGVPGAIPEGMQVQTPVEYLKPLSPEQQDPNPVAPLGYYKLVGETDTSSLHLIGVDYLGYQLVEPKSVNGEFDRYVAFFTLQSPANPDELAVIQIAFWDSDRTNLGTYINAEGEFSDDAMSGPEFAQLLKNHNPVGRRFVLNLYIDDNTWGGPDRQRFIDALRNGTPVPSGLDFRTVPSFINPPTDLHP